MTTINDYMAAFCAETGHTIEAVMASGRGDRVLWRQCARWMENKARETPSTPEERADGYRLYAESCRELGQVGAVPPPPR